MTRMSARKMLCLLILLCISAVNSEIEKEIAEDGEKGTTQDDEKEITQDDKVQCIKKFVDWCNSMQYPQERGSGMSLVSISYHDDKTYYRVFCSSDSDGTNCSRNGSPWFSCAPDHVLTYKGEVLTETTTNVDNDICKTQQKAFNQLFVQNMSYDNASRSVIEKELKSFFREMLAMRQQMHELQKRLGDGSFLGGDFWGGLGGFPFKTDEDEENEDVETVTPDKKKDSNDIEKE